MRSPLAHARIRRIVVPPQHKACVFTADDLDGVLPIKAVSGLQGFKVSVQPPLATGKVRQVGELVAMCVAPTRAEAEDIAALVVVELEELPAVHDMLAARDPAAPLVHEHWGDNVFLETLVDTGIAAAFDRTHQGDAHDHDRTAMHGADRRPRRRDRDARSPRRPARTAHRKPDAAYRAQWPRGLPRFAAGAHPRRLAGCRRRLRLQGDPAGRRSLPRLARAALRPSAALARRGPARAPHRERQLPRAPLLHHGLCGARRDAARHRLRGDRRFGCVLGLSVLGLPPRAAQVASILPGPYDFPAYRCQTWSVATRKQMPPSFRIAASRAPASASRSSWCSMRSRPRRVSSLRWCA